MLVHHLLIHVSHVLALWAPGVTAPASPPPTVPDPTPASPVSSNGVNLLLGYAKWGSLTACGGSA